MTRLQELEDQRKKLDLDSRAILDKAEAETRENTSDELAEWDRMDADIDKLTGEIERRRKQGARDKSRTDSQGRRAGANATTLLDGRDPDPSRPTEFVLEFLRHGRTQKQRIKPGTPEHDRCQPEYHEAFEAFLGGGAVQSGALMVGSQTQGGYLAPTLWSAELIRALDDQVFMRQIGNVLPPMTAGASLGFPSLDADPADADWTAEVPASDISEDTTMALGAREMVPSLLTKLIKISRLLLRTAVIDVESLVRERLAYKFAITEEKHFLTGDGAQTPLGIFTASAAGITTARDVTAASATEIAGDDLIDVFYALKGQYMNRATWVVHRDFIKRVRKMKGDAGNYLWSAGLGGQPSTILDRPYVMNENAPNTFTTGQYVAVVGDFSFYWIADSLGMEVQRLDELFALRNQVGLLGRKETDGMPVLAEAFSRLKMA